MVLANFDKHETRKISNQKKRDGNICDAAISVYPGEEVKQQKLLKLWKKIELFFTKHQLNQVLKTMLTKIRDSKKEDALSAAKTAT